MINPGPLERERTKRTARVVTGHVPSRTFACRAFQRGGGGATWQQRGPRRASGALHLGPARVAAAWVRAAVRRGRAGGLRRGLNSLEQSFLCRRGPRPENRAQGVVICSVHRTFIS
jgi:hypothetical protein